MLPSMSREVAPAPYCRFCAFAAGQEKCFLLWESATHMAFLTPFPNVKGFTVVIPRRHLSSYVFDLEDAEYRALLAAAREVGHLLDRAFDVGRTALIAEGMGIDHVHVKLLPLHGVRGEWQQVSSTVRTVYPTYPGYVASHDGPRESDEELERIAAHVRSLSRPSPVR
jgi:histidine triad (HIT) family protein